MSIENVRGSAFDNQILGDSGDNHLFGMAGNDILYGGLGHDTLEGGAGNDLYFVNPGDEDGAEIFDESGYDRIRFSANSA